VHKAKAIEYLDERIKRLGRGLNSIRQLQDQILPDELESKLDEVELLLRGYIHKLEEDLNAS
jgi:uncharacterized protein YdeI (YjbR/CyaY-like superfamily)